MAKVLNAVFGIGIAVVVYIIVLLGIEAFYAEPREVDFCNETGVYYDPILSFAKCQDNITVGACRKTMDFREKDAEKCQKEFMEVNKIYSRNFFIIASIIGLIITVVAFFLISLTNISAGVACSGIVLIFWAFIRGWQSTDTKIKFIIGLIIAVVVITLGVIVNRKLANK